MNTAMWSAQRLSGEASEQVTPPFPARDPRLLVCCTEPLLCRTYGAARARFGAWIWLVDFRQRLFFPERGCTRVPNLARTEQSFPEGFFHRCICWLIVRRTPSSP